MQTYFQDNKSKKLILFFNGWGMDERPLQILKSSYDILHVFDYNNLDFDVDIDFSTYDEIVLIAFSAGVFMSAFVQDKLPKFDLKIAVNGALKLFDNELGVNEETIAMMKSVTLENALDLRAKFIKNQTQLTLFNANQPLRTLESSLNEISALEKFYQQGCKNFTFDKVIISNDDEIISSKNQLSAWDVNKNSKIQAKFVEGGHFIFYNFESFDDIITF